MCSVLGIAKSKFTFFFFFLNVLFILLLLLLVLQVYIFDNRYFTEISQLFSDFFQNLDIYFLSIF